MFEKLEELSRMDKVRNEEVCRIIIIIIIIKKRLAMQGWERAINTLSVRRPQPHNTNP